MKARTILFALLTGLSQAQEVHWGVHFGMVVPIGDLANTVGNSIGYGGDLHLILDPGGANVFRVRLGGMDFAGSPTGQTGLKAQVRATTGALDYLWFAEGAYGNGFYCTAGLDLTHWRVEFTSPSVDSTQEDKSSIGGTIGCGYQFSPTVGTELSYFRSRFRQESGNAGGFSFGFSVRF